MLSKGKSIAVQLISSLIGLDSVALQWKNKTNTGSRVSKEWVEKR